MARDQFAVVQQIMKRQETEAGVRLSSAQGALADAESQLKQIVDYRQEYHRLATGENGNVTDTSQLQAARYFLSELDKIARQQRITAQQAERALEQQQIAWADAKRRLTAIEKLQSQRKKKQQIAGEKREQRALDDLFVVRQLFDMRATKAGEKAKLMIVSLTTSLDSGPKAEQSKMALQGVDSSLQKFADNMNELLTDELTMDINKPQQYGPNIAIDSVSDSSDSVDVASDSVSDSSDSVDVASDSVAGEEGAFPTNFQQTLTDLTNQPHSDFTGTAAGGSIPAELTLNMVEAGRKLAGSFLEVSNIGMIPSKTATSAASKALFMPVALETVGIGNSLASTSEELSLLLDAGNRGQVSKATDTPLPDPRLEAGVVRTAETSTIGITKTHMTAGQSGSVDTGIKLSNTEPQQFAGEMATHVRVLKSQSGGEVKLNLHPAELGRLSISVSTEGSETKVIFVVENTQARQSIETALPRLREMLDEAGLSLTESDVSERQDDRKSTNEDDQDTGSLVDSGDTKSSNVRPIEMSVFIDPDRLLDTFA
ncbi:MAG: flagellar export protein FliJ [Pseudomonadota bacterium]|nr:flagellar export protein FliJ [Pseudomonadota bacterium]